MANIDPAPSWANIRRLETTDRNMAGPGGILNDPTTSIAARLNLLRDNDTTLGNSIADVNSRQDAADTAIANIQGQVLNAPGTLSDLENGAALDPVAGFPDVPSVENALGPVDAINEPIKSLAARTKKLRDDLTATADALEIQRVLVDDFVQPSDGDDIALAFQRAVNAAEGRVVQFSPKAYVVSSVANLVAENVVVDARGASFTVSYAGTFVRMPPPTFTNIQSISPISGSDFWGARKEVVCTDGSAFSVGDTVKVVSDDKQPNTRPGAEGLDYRRGLIAVVEKISGNTLTLDRPIPWSLTTNPRVGQMPRRRFAWAGGVIGYERGHEADWRGQAMILYGVTDVQVDVEIEHTYNAAVSVVGCFAPYVRAVGRDLLNNEVNLQYGYLVNDSSQFGEFHLFAGRNRHAYTTNMPTVAAGSSDLYLYGATYASTVSGSCHGNSQAGFDTHHGADSITFDNCVASGGTTGGGQFVVRGQNIRLINPRGFNGKEGLFVYCEAGVTEPTTATVVGAEFVVDRYPIVVSANCQLELQGSSRLRSNKYGRCVVVSSSSVSLQGTLKVIPGGATEVNSSRAIDLTDSTFDCRAGSILFDLAAIPNDATNYGLVQHGGAVSTTWHGGVLRSINDAGLTSVFIKASSAGGGYVENIVAPKMFTDKLGYAPGANTSINVTGAAGSIISAWSWQQAGGAGGSSYIQATVGAAGYVIPWRGRGDPVTMVRLFNNTTSVLDLGALPAGAFPGQVIHLSVVTAGGSLVVKHGATYNTGLPGGSDITLTSEQGVTLVCNGSGRWNALKN